MARSIGKGYRVGKGGGRGVVGGIFFFLSIKVLAAFFVWKNAEMVLLLFGGESEDGTGFPGFFCNNPVNHDGFLGFFKACARLIDSEDGFGVEGGSLAASSFCNSIIITLSISTAINSVCFT